MWHHTHVHCNYTVTYNNEEKTERSLSISINNSVNPTHPLLLVSSRFWLKIEEVGFNETGRCIYDECVKLEVSSEKCTCTRRVWQSLQILMHNSTGSYWLGARHGFVSLVPHSEKKYLLQFDRSHYSLDIVRQTKFQLS